MSAAPAHVLVVEDEARIASVLRDYLEAGGYRVSVTARGDAAWSLIEADPPALALLDLMLPGLDGLELCRRVRAADDRRIRDMRVIMVTARIDELDRLLGLEVGADDYVCKPFSPREVVARVRAQLRRMSPGDGPAGPLRVELCNDSMRARADGHDIDLTPVEMRLLACLLEHPGRVYSRQQLMDAAYTDHRVVSDRTIDTHVKNLRRKLSEALAAEAPIASVYGVGYRYEE